MMEKYYWNSNWDKTKERLQALWENEIVDRACVAISVTDENAYRKHVVRMEDLSNEDLKRSYVDPVFMTERFREKMKYTKYMGDAFPCIGPDFGTSGFIQYAGSIPNYAPDTIWFDPVLNEPEADMIAFHKDIYEEHIRIMKELVALSKDEYFISMPDHCGILDGLASMRGSEQLLFDLIEEPEFVKAGVHRLVDLQKKVIPGFYREIYKNNRNGITHSWMQLWSEKRIMQIQCDFSVMISPEFYEEFVLPEIELSGEWVDYAVYHLDGQEQIRHLDHILSADIIKMIQWTPVAGQPPTSAFIPVLQKIQKAGKGLVLFLKPWEVEIVMDQLSSKGLRIIVQDVHSEEAAKELIDMVERKTHD